MAGLYAPLPTHRRRPRGRLRTDRGRRGLLLPHRSGLSPHTPCRSPGALTRVAACTLALSPIRDTLSEGFSHFVTSIAAPVASGWSGCRVGLAPTGKRRLNTAHTHLGHSMVLHTRAGTIGASASTSRRCLLSCLQRVSAVFLPFREKAPESRVKYSAPVGQLVEVEVRS